MDSKVVNFISSCSDSHGNNTYLKYDKKTKTRKATPIPPVAHSYRKNMGFVDAHDRNLSLYRVKIFSKKWWHVLFFNMLDMACSNAWIVYRNVNNVKVSQKKFRIELIKQLAEINVAKSKVHCPYLALKTPRKCVCTPDCQSRSRYRCSSCQKVFVIEHFMKGHCKN